MARKPQQQRERRYVPEFVNNKYPDRVTVFYNMAVGPPPEAMYRANPEIPLKHFRRWRFWIDAVVVLKEKLVLIEGKLRRPADGLGQLLIYRALLKDTPELRPYRKLPVYMVLVTARPDPRVISVATYYGITVEIFTPAWAMEYLRSKGLA